MLSSGWLEGYRLDFTHYSSGWGCGVADVIINEESDVWGLIYEVQDADLDSLDDFEGYPDVYTRFQTTLSTQKGSLSEVWVYSVVDKKNFIPPSSTYLGILMKAAKTFSFPNHYRKMLEGIPVAL